MRLPHAIGSLLCLFITACINLPDIEASPPESPSDAGVNGDAGTSDAGYDGGPPSGDGGVDHTAPTLVRTVPLNYTTRVPLDSPVEIDFSEEMDPSSLRLSSTASISFNLISWTSETLRAVFRASAPFAQDTQYTVTVEGRDLAGNSLSEGNSLTFTTIGPAPDTTPPALLDFSPPQGATGVPRSGTIKLIFSEPMNKSSVESAFSLATTIAGSFIWDSEGTEVIFDPSTDLPYGTFVQWELMSGAVDLSGNAIPSTSHSFRIIRSSTGTLSVEGNSQLVYDTDRISNVVPWPIGDDISNKAYRAGISFRLAMNSELTRITEAVLVWSVDYDSCDSNPSCNPFMNLGALVVEPVNYGNSWDPQTIWYTPAVGPPLLIDSASSLNVESGYARLPVLAMVADAWANRSTRSMNAQFRLRFESLTNSDSRANYLKISNSTVKLVVTYEHP